MTLALPRCAACRGMLFEGCDAEGGGCNWGPGVWSRPVASMLATMPVPNCPAGFVSPIAAEESTAGTLDIDCRLVLGALPCTTWAVLQQP